MRLEDAALSLDVLDDLHVELAAVGTADGGGEGLVGDPLGGGTGSGLLHHAVNLLEGQTLGLRDKEPRVDDFFERVSTIDKSRSGVERVLTGTGAQTTPNEENGRFKVTLVLVDLD